MQKELTNFIAVVLICGTIFGVGYNLKNTGISIKNTGTVGNMVQNSISVSGEGKVTATPDIVRIQAGVSVLGKTTKEAQEATNQKITKILEILKKNNISENNIQTANLTFSEEYDWSEKERKVIGQRVRQSLNIKIPEISENPKRITDILDEMGTIDGLELDSVTFDIEDKKELYTKARAEAFAKAQQKAEELANLSGVKLLKPITITESNDVYFPPVYQNYARADLATESAGGSSVPAGELEITENLNIIFGIQ